MEIVELIGYGYRKTQGYFLLVFGSGVLLIFPDVILEWISEKTGQDYDRRHALILQGVGLTILIVSLNVTWDSELNWFLFFSL
jgi:hypothetical protein